MLAAVLAALEVLLGFGAGHFIIRDRAEPDAFLAFRPWILLLPVLAAGWRGTGWRMPLLAMALFVAIATLAEWGVTALVGDPDAGVLWRAGAASMALGAMAMAVWALFHRLMGNHGMATAAALIFAIGALAMRPPLPSAMHMFEMSLRPGPEPEPTTRPHAVLLTGLPLVWGEGSPLAVAKGQARPPAMWQAMRDAAAIHPVDVIDGKALAGAALLILAQPPMLAPAELVRIDDWVRQGGKILIFNDPDLLWAGEWQGVPGRAPRMAMLSPLLDHWGIGTTAAAPGWRLIRWGLATFGVGRIAVGNAGAVTGPAGCRTMAEGLVAECPVGQGKAVIVGDADLLADAAWAGSAGASRAARIADNGVFVQSLIRMTAGVPVITAHGDEVRWMTRHRPGWLLLAAGLMPAIAAIMLALAVRLRMR